MKGRSHDVLMSATLDIWKKLGHSVVCMNNDRRVSDQVNKELWRNYTGEWGGYCVRPALSIGTDVASIPGP